MYLGPETHDHCLEIEAAVMKWAGAHSFERLFAICNNLVEELVREVILNNCTRTRDIVLIDLEGDHLIHPERSMITIQSYISQISLHGR
jgi:hypothetical protein